MAQWCVVITGHWPDSSMYISATDSAVGAMLLRNSPNRHVPMYKVTWSWRNINTSVIASNEPPYIRHNTRHRLRHHCRHQWGHEHRRGVSNSLQILTETVVTCKITYLQNISQMASRNLAKFATDKQAMETRKNIYKVSPKCITRLTRCKWICTQAYSDVFAHDQSIYSWKLQQLK